MGKRFKHELLFQSRCLNLYLLFGFFTSLFLVGSLVYRVGTGPTLLHYPLCVTFLVTNYFILTFGSDSTAILSLLHPLIKGFLFQFVLLLSCSFELAHPGPLFMSTLPLVAALFTIQSDWFLSREEKFQKGASILGIVSFAYLLVFLNLREGNGEMITISTLLGLILWQVGTIYLANMEWFKLSREFLFKKLKKIDIPSHPINRERYFFHDVINHTHGVNLMLRARIMKNRGLTYEETLSLVTEIGALQSLVQDHYGLGHKNLKDAWKMKSFSVIKNMMIHVVENFLPENKTEVYYHFKGTFAEDSKEDPKISFVPVYRIFTNLIKNCSEANAKKVEIIFDGKDEYFNLLVKNDVYQKRSRNYDLGQNLAKLIQMNQKEVIEFSGVGLEAIESLCQENGGSFSFKIEEGTWISEILFPMKDSLYSKDKLLNFDKKAS